MITENKSKCRILSLLSHLMTVNSLFKVAMEKSLQSKQRKQMMDNLLFSRVYHKSLRVSFRVISNSKEKITLSLFCNRQLKNESNKWRKNLRFLNQGTKKIKITLWFVDPMGKSLL